MNILFISYGLYPCNIGGTEIFNYYLIKELSKSHKIFVMTFCKEKIDLDAVVIRINRKKFGSGKISVPLLSFTHIMKLRKEIDVIHLPYMSPDWPAWIPLLITKKMFNIPYIISIRGGGLRKWRPMFPYKFLFKNAAAIVGNSVILKNEYEKRTGMEVTCVPSGLPFQRCSESRDKLKVRYGIGLSDVVIICVGSLKEIKGSDVLLNAFVELGEKYIRQHNIKLLFVGDGEMRKELEKRIEKENFSEYARIVGYVPHEDISAFYKLADIYIIPSLFEGMSNALLEAMFNELPIIGSNTRGISNMITHGSNGLLFQLNNCVNLRDNIKYLIENRDAANKIALGAKRTYEDNYKYDTVVKRYEEIYEKVGRI